MARHSITRTARDRGVSPVPEARDRDLAFRVDALEVALERSLRLSTMQRKYDETSFATGINVQVPRRR